MSADDQIEQAIVAAGATVAPRITAHDIDMLMERVTYVQIAQAGDTTSSFVHAYLDGKFHLSTGHSACVSPENFRPEVGLALARRKAEVGAREKLWELEGYALYKRLAAG